MEEKPRIARLTAILTQLQSKRIVTATYLAEKHQVSRSIEIFANLSNQGFSAIHPQNGRAYIQIPHPYF